MPRRSYYPGGSYPTQPYGAGPGFAGSMGYFGPQFHPGPHQGRGSGLGPRGGSGKRRWRGGPHQQANTAPPVDAQAHSRPRKRSRRHHGKQSWRGGHKTAVIKANIQHSSPFDPLSERPSLSTSPKSWWLEGLDRTTPRTVPPAPYRDTPGFLAPGKEHLVQCCPPFLGAPTIKISADLH